MTSPVSPIHSFTPVTTAFAIPAFVPLLALLLPSVALVPPMAIPVLWYVCYLAVQVQCNEMYWLTWKCSPGHSKPLSLVPPLQRSSSEFLVLRLLVWPRPRCPFVHGDRIVLWALRVARPLRIVRLVVGGRECLAVHGLRVCDWRR